MTDFTRRRAFGLFAAPAILAATDALSRVPTPAFTLLLVGDIDRMGEEDGRGGFARVAGIAAAERARGVPVLFCHAGDCFSPSLMSGFDKGAHVVAIQNLIGLDVFVPGNHEFDFGKETYLALAAAQTYPSFAANLRDAAGGRLPGHRDSQIFEIGGVRLGVIGAALERTPLSSSPGDLVFSSAVEALRRESARLRAEGAQIVVAVTHADRATDLEIVRLRLVDILLSGHDHDLAVSYDGEVAMAEAGEQGRHVVAIDIAVAAAGGGRVNWTPTFRIHDSRAATPDPRVAALVAGYEAQLSAELDVEIATLAAPLDSRREALRTRESAIGNLVADAMRIRTGAQLAIGNAGGVRANRLYPAGHRLTRRDVLGELPFANTTVLVEITGADVKAAVENGLRMAPLPAGRFPLISGFAIEADAGRPPGERVTAMTIDGTPMDMAALYTVASNNFLLARGDGYEALARGRVLIGLSDGRLLANEVMAHARRLGSVAATVDGRIRLR